MKNSALGFVLFGVSFSQGLCFSILTLISCIYFELKLPSLLKENGSNDLLNVFLNGLNYFILYFLPFMILNYLIVVKSGKLSKMLKNYNLKNGKLYRKFVLVLFFGSFAILFLYGFLSPM